MPFWLLKSDPDEYSAEDLAHDGATVWDGVSNALAQQHIRTMRKNDKFLIYHTGSQKEVVAAGRITQNPRPAPGDALGKTHVIDVKFDRWLKRPITLADIKAEKAFADFALVRIGRLSVMPVTEPQWNRLVEMGEGLVTKRPDDL